MMRVGFQQHHRLKARSVHSNLCRFPVSPCMRTVLGRHNFFAKILSVGANAVFLADRCKGWKNFTQKTQKNAAVPAKRAGKRVIIIEAPAVCAAANGVY